jgi:hypothetical protein
MKFQTVALGFFALLPLGAGCAVESGSADEEETVAGVSEEELSVAAARFQGDYVAKEAAQALGFSALSLGADGKYSAAFTPYCAPGRMCILGFVTVAGQWSVAKNAGLYTLTLRNTSASPAETRRYSIRFTTGGSKELRLARGNDSQLLKIVPVVTCAQVRCAAGTTCVNYPTGAVCESRGPKAGLWGGEQIHVTVAADNSADIQFGCASAHIDSMALGAAGAFSSAGTLQRRSGIQRIDPDTGRPVVTPPQSATFSGSVIGNRMQLRMVVEGGDPQNYTLDYNANTRLFLCL